MRRLRARGAPRGIGRLPFGCRRSSMNASAVSLASATAAWNEAAAALTGILFIRVTLVCGSFMPGPCPPDPVPRPPTHRSHRAGRRELRIAVDAPRRSAASRAASRAALCLIRGPVLRTVLSICRSAQRDTLSSSRSKSMLAGVDIPCLHDYGFSRSRDRARPGRHGLPGSSPRMTVRWWSSEARLLYDGDGTDDWTGWPEATRGRREQDRS